MKSESWCAPAWLLVLVVVCTCAPLAGLVHAQDNAKNEPPAVAISAQNSGSANDATEGAASSSPAQSAAGSDAPEQAPESSSNVENTSPVQAAGRNVSEATLIPNFLRDQKDLWLFPLKMSQRDHWIPALIVGGVTAGLLAVDAHDTPYFRQTTTFNDFNHAFASNITMSEVLAAPASFYAVGLLTKDPYARKTGLLAGEALADVTVLSAVIKAVTRQTRPEAIPPYGNFSDTFFRAKGDPFSSGFPSGHSISAFAVATVIAERYGKRHRWVPFVAYGAAAMIGFSRVTTQAHFPSDVFLGAALGYGVARFDVLHMSWGSPQQ